MTLDERDRRAEELFGEALARPSAERAAFLNEACAGDAALRRELLELLRYAEDEPDFLASPVLRPAMPDLAEVFGVGDGDEPLPDEIGGYPIVRMLGRGATGVVYEARQRRPSRPVAVKLLYPGPTSLTLLARFIAEARLLARLDHPGIARFYEAGTEEVPGPHGTLFRLLFLVMEHVPGKRLDRWADDPDRPLAELLRTFAAVCDAVAHAHRRGVLHRDLKPANILVTREGHPKVLDFGIACAARAAGTEQTRLTATGQVLGSLAYISPEQLRDSRRADERSDVYSLGVILYRLLTGHLPLEVTDLPLTEAAAVIEGTPPPPLSRHDRALGGELETLVATAMAKAPKSRYASAADLAADLRHYLAHRPIRARGRGWWRGWFRHVGF